MSRTAIALTIVCLIGLAACGKPTLPSQWSALFLDATARQGDPSNPMLVWVDNSDPNSPRVKSSVTTAFDGTTITALFVNNIEYTITQNNTGAYSCQYGYVGKEDVARLKAIVNFMDNAQFVGMYGAAGKACSVWLNVDDKDNVVGGCFSSTENHVPLSMSVGSDPSDPESAFVMEFSAQPLAASVFAVPAQSVCQKFSSRLVSTNAFRFK